MNENSLLRAERKATWVSPDEKRHQLPGESLEGYFARLIANNWDIPDHHVEEFTKFMDRQADAFKSMRERNSHEEKKALELGFDSLLEYREHISMERTFRERLTAVRRMEDFRHASNVFAMESLFIEWNRQSVDEIYPEFKNKLMLGKHSHQLIFDLIYSTCRGFNRNLVDSIMVYFGKVDTEKVQREAVVEFSGGLP